MLSQLVEPTHQCSLMFLAKMKSPSRNVGLIEFWMHSHAQVYKQVRAWLQAS